MSEVRALRKHPCPECGGDAEWDPRKRALACPYCGTVLPWSEGEERLGETIREHDLEEVLAKMGGEERGLKKRSVAVRCESCRAISVFDEGKAAQRCDFCGSPAIIPAEHMEAMITPESLLPAVVPQTQVRAELKKWYGSRWFAPNRLKRAALTDTIHGIYVPYWTFDAHADAKWQAEAGYHYYTTESYVDAHGRRKSRQVQHTRWEWAEGELQHFFDDDLVPGTVGVHLALLREVEPFPTRKELKAYDPAYVRGWTVERYQVDLREASVTSMRQMEQRLMQLCAAEVPGDTQRNLRVQAVYSARTFKHVLVPVWLVTYDYGARSFQVVVNGFTGKIAGERPYSAIKIALAVIAGLIVVALLCLYVAEG